MKRLEDIVFNLWQYWNITIPNDTELRDAAIEGACSTLRTHIREVATFLKEGHRPFIESLSKTASEKKAYLQALTDLTTALCGQEEE